MAKNTFDAHPPGQDRLERKLRLLGRIEEAPEKKNDKPRVPTPHETETLAGMLLDSVYSNHLQLAERLLEQGATIDFVHPQTGLTALHIAVGRDHLAIARLLVARGAAFLPDTQGRMPSTIAAECEVSDEMCDFIAEAEAKAEGV